MSFTFFLGKGGTTGISYFYLDVHGVPYMRRKIFSANRLVVTVNTPLRLLDSFYRRCHTHRHCHCYRHPVRCARTNDYREASLSSHSYSTRYLLDP